MIRNVLAVLAALVVGNLTIFGVQSLNWALFPMPPGVDFDDPAAVAAMVAAMPLGAFAGIELSYLAGSVLPGFVVAKAAGSRHLALAAVVGALFTVANTLNLMAIPHPLWFAALTTVTFLPVTLAVTWLAAPAQVRSST